MRSQKKNVAMLCLFYFLSYVAFVLPYGYMQTFLEYVGYDVVERGIILSGTAVVAIITQFFIGYLCDKYKTDKKFFNLCLIVFVLSTLVMYQVTPVSYTHLREEIRSMVESGQESGLFDEDEADMIDSVFAFDDILAEEVMTPRPDVFCIDIDDPQSEYLDELMEMRYSRIPVYRDSIDNIIGILNIKDFVVEARKNGFEHVDISRILRKPFFVLESKNIDDLFREMQSKHQHIAILIDEYGGFSGIVTMEDLVEEIMGDIEDEYDEDDEAQIEKMCIRDSFHSLPMCFRRRTISCFPGESLL